MDPVIFQNVSELKDNFEKNFAKAELGGILKEIVIKTTPDNEKVYADDNITFVLSKAINEVSDSAFNNKENYGSYLSTIKDEISKYSSMEANYREERVISRLESGKINWYNDNDRDIIHKYFAQEGFLSPTIKNSYKDRINFLRSLEEDSIVTEIAGNVGQAVIEAEEKSAIIGETINVIQKEKEKIQDDLEEDIKEVNDNDEELNNDTNENDTQEETTTDNTEETEDDTSSDNESTEENENTNEETSEESLNRSLEDDINTAIIDGLTGDSNKENPIDVTESEPINEDPFKVFNETDNKELKQEVIAIEHLLDERALKSLEDELNSDIIIDPVNDDTNETEENINKEPIISEESITNIYQIPMQTRKKIYTDIVNKKYGIEEFTYTEPQKELSIEEWIKKSEEDLNYLYSLEALGKNKKKKRISLNDVPFGIKTKIYNMLIKKYKTKAGALIALQNAKKGFAKDKNKIKEKFNKEKSKSTEDVKDVIKIIFAVLAGISWAIVILDIIKLIFGLAAGLTVGPLFIIPFIINLGCAILFTLTYTSLDKNVKENINNLLNKEIPSTIDEYNKATDNDTKSQLKRLFNQEFKQLKKSLNTCDVDFIENTKLSNNYKKIIDFDNKLKGNESINNYKIPKKYKKALKKEYLNLKFSNESIGKTIVPISPNQIDQNNIPSLKALTSIYIKGSENLRDYIDARFDKLKEFIDRENDDELTSKYNNLRERSNEAFNNASVIKDKLWQAGFTPFGIIDPSNKLSIFIGRKLIKTINSGHKVTFSLEDLEEEQNPKFGKELDEKDATSEENVNEGEHGTPPHDLTDYNSVEHLINQSFDLCATKIRYNRNPSTKLKQEILSKEGILFENISTLPEDQKQAVINVMNLSEIDWDGSILVKDEFVNSLKLAVTNIQVITSKAVDQNDAIKERAIVNLEGIFGRALIDDEKNLIAAIISGVDSTDIVPSVFEKFLLKEAKKEPIDSELGQENIEFIKNKSKCLLAIHTTVNKLNILSQEDLKEFNDYLLDTKENLKY
jgi:hypothetical protein